MIVVSDLKYWEGRGEKERGVKVVSLSAVEERYSTVVSER